MTPRLSILSAGPGVTLQDGGRHGGEQQGDDGFHLRNGWVSRAAEPNDFTINAALHGSR